MKSILFMILVSAFSIPAFAANNCQNQAHKAALALYKINNPGNGALRVTSVWPMPPFLLSLELSTFGMRRSDPSERRARFIRSA